VEGLIECSDGDVGGLGGWPGEKRRDVGSKWLQRVGRLCIVIGQ
jgi:hypothetical protein